MTAASTFLLNWIVEISSLPAVLLGSASLLTPQLRLILSRAAFSISLIVPATMICGVPHWSIMTWESAPLIMRAPAETFPIVGVTTETVLQQPGWTQLNSFALLILLWGAGAAVVMFRYFRSLGLLRRLFAEAARPSASLQQRLEGLRERLGIRPQVELRVSQAIPAACTFGWLRPRILVSDSDLGDMAALDAVLAHELCHIRARDALWLMVARLACAVHWFNPLIWLCSNRHRADIELVCDAAVTEREIETGTYLRALVESARRATRKVPIAAPMMSAVGIQHRIRFLATPLGRTLGPNRLGKAASYAGCLIMLTMLVSTDLVASQPMQSPILTQPAQPGPKFSMAKAFPTAKPNAIRAELNSKSVPPAAEAARIAPVAVANGQLYLTVAEGVTVWARSIGFMCSGIACLATEPAGTELTLTASSVEPKPLRWSGCNVLPDGRSCSLRLGDEPSRVEVRH